MYKFETIVLKCKWPFKVGNVKRTRVLLADDHAIFLDGLACLLRNQFEVVGTARDGRRMIDMAKATRPDVIVIDISMPRLNGIDAAQVLRTDIPSARFVFLTMHSDLPLIAQVVHLGASGFILKTCDFNEVVTAIQVVAKGATYITPLIAGDFVSTLMTRPQDSSPGTPLTSRQREVLQLLTEGKTMKETAALMGISTRTAETHKYEMMRQLGIDTTAGLIRYALRIKLV
jgi:DNA-binding NarL/FixJ family response regulator